MLLLGLGMGTAFMPAMSLATHGVEPRDAGVASAMVNTSQQVGGAIGTALLNTIAAVGHHRVHHRPHRRCHHPSPAAAASSSRRMVHGYTSAIWWAVGILVVAAGDRLHLHQRRPPGRRGAVAGSRREDGVRTELKVPVVAH